MPLLADVSRGDVSLLLRQGDQALVIAQAAPRSIASVYAQPWIGRRLPLTEDPLLAGGLLHSRRGRRQLDLLDQGATIVQQVMPLISPAEPIPAILQIQTTLIAWERHKRRHPSFRKAVLWLQDMGLRGDLPGAGQLSRFSEWDGILFVDATLTIRYLSGIANNLYRRLGYLEDLHGCHVGDLQTRDELLIQQAFEARCSLEHQVEEGNRHWTRKVVPVWSYPRRWPLGQDIETPTRLRGALVMVHDETEALRKAQELQVLATMIQEVHHRVKNNLQTVASILRMQARRTHSQETRLHLGEAVNRVLAIAVIHEFLSQDSEQSINIRDVCQRIAAQTQRAAVQPDKRLVLRVEGPAIYLPSQQATACALVVNELLLNAVEHAFGGQETGTVSVSLNDQGDRVLLEVIDDGVGLPPGFDEAGSDSLGLNIVRTLVEGDLKGQLVLEPGSPGTRAIIMFEKGLRGREH